MLPAQRFQRNLMYLRFPRREIFHIYFAKPFIQQTFVVPYFVRLFICLWR